MVWCSGLGTHYNTTIVSGRFVIFNKHHVRISYNYTAMGI